MTIQELQFELIKRASFNNFDGEAVVASLQKNNDLWQGVVMDRASYCFHGPTDNGSKIDLIKLRDISYDEWNVDTLFILPTDGKAAELMKLAKTWAADEVDWIKGREADRLLGAGGSDKQILRVWWD